jgi:SAM-dependent methyltransferase
MSDRLADTVPEPWQLQMFRHALKKQQKLRALSEMLGSLSRERCLLVTCGDNNGALNWLFRQAGGQWRWVEAEAESAAQISELLNEQVELFEKADPRLPYGDGAFEVVVVIDVHEHVPAPLLLNQELARVVRPGGRILVTTPSGDPRRLANRIKRWVGMRKEAYGHVVDGYDIPALEQQLRQAQLLPHATGGYSGFFTEMVELLINVAYVKVLSRRSRDPLHSGQIAPQSREQVRSVAKSYRWYTRLFPVMRALAAIDRLGPFGRGHAVMVLATKPHS